MWHTGIALGCCVLADGGCLDLKDGEWAAVEPVLRPTRRGENPGVRPWHETRAVLNGVFGCGNRAHSSRAAGALPAIPDLPLAFSAVDSLRQAGSGVAAVGCPPTRA